MYLEGEDSETVSVWSGKRPFGETMKEVLTEVGKELYLLWYASASAELKTSRSAYQNSMAIKDLGDGVTMFTLSGKFAVALEDGAPGYIMDMTNHEFIPLNTSRLMNFVYPYPSATWVPSIYKEGKFSHPGFAKRQILEKTFSKNIGPLLSSYLRKAL